MLGRASLALQWFGPRTWIGAPPRRSSGTPRRPRLWPLRAGTTAPAQPPTRSRKGVGGLKSPIPTRQALVVRPNAALRGGPDETTAGGGRSGTRTGALTCHRQPPSLSGGALLPPIAALRWVPRLCFLPAVAAAAAATPSPSQTQRLARRGPPAPSPEPPLTAPSHPLAGNTASSRHNRN